MRPSLLQRSLRFYGRSHLAVVAGMATAAAVLTGALLVGDSVRASLRALVDGRLGKVDHVIRSDRFFRAELARDLAIRPAFAASFRAAAPLIVLEGILTEESGGRRAAGVAVYGVDESYWAFQGVEGAALGAREAYLSPSLAQELAARAGTSVLLRLHQAAAIPGASLFGRREDLGKTVRLTVKGGAKGGALEFSLGGSHQATRAVFLPLRLLQRTLEREGRANTLLLAEKEGVEGGRERAGAAADLLAESVTLEDLGLRLRVLPDGRGLSLESETALIGDVLATRATAAAAETGLKAVPVLTYLANAIRGRGGAIPYSLVTGVEWGPGALGLGLPAGAPEPGPPPIVLNDWAARDLGVGVGDRIDLDYYVWLEEGRLITRTATFRLAAIVPIVGPAGDRDFAPEYPGITTSAHLSDWDPPFPIDLSRVRPRDEDYWDRHRTTPKAFVPLAVGQELWGHRLGRLTSVRVVEPPGATAAGDGRARLANALRGSLDPAAAGFTVTPVRAQGRAASVGATDFGEYFLYFSSFLVWAALLLAGLFFRLGVEQRQREIGLLRAVGFTKAAVRLAFLREGAVLAGVGGLLGAAAAALYAWGLLFALRTFWVDAVGTRSLALHVAPSTLVFGALAGVAMALVSVALTLRGLDRWSVRGLLAGAAGESRAGGPRPWVGRLAVGAFGGAALLTLLSLPGTVSETGGFFGAGMLLLTGGLALVAMRLGRRPTQARALSGVVGLGVRNASYRPGRSLLCIALIASATFLVVAVGAFRQGGHDVEGDPRSGTGGYALLAESLLPIHHDPNTPEGREALNLDVGSPSALVETRFARFRLRPGDDASCLNLYQPRNPRLLGATEGFRRAGRFSFQASLATTTEERANPWLLLDSPHTRSDEPLPAIADANSLAYVLHKKLGEELVLERVGARPVRLRLVGALQGSVFQGEVIVGERDFVRAFPEADGYRFFLLAPPRGRADEVARELESRLSDLGLDVQSAAERLAGFHRVENTYLSTFQALGGLGLVLGTVGLATVLLRNAFERRRELAVLRAVGYHRGHLERLVLAENVMLLFLGLGTGTAAALLAVAPALARRGEGLALTSLAGLLVVTSVTGLVVSRLAVNVIRRWDPLAALRTE